MAQEDRDEKKRLLKTEKPHLILIRDTTIMIGLVTLLGYLIAYNYQKGFKGYYKLEGVLLGDITITQIIVSIASLLGVAVTIFQFTPLLMDILEFNKDNKRWVITRYAVKYWIIPLLIILYLVKYQLYADYNSILYVLIVYILVVVIPKVVSPIFHKGEGYLQELRNSILHSKVSLVGIAKFSLLESTRVFIVVLFAAFIVIGALSLLIGYSSAANKRTYYYLKHENKTYIVLSNYDNKIIIAPYKKKKNTIVTSYQIIDSTSTFEKPYVFKVLKLDSRPKVK